MTSVEELLSSPVLGHEGQCLVCYSALEYPAITPCGHNEVCGTCHLRLRFLHNDKKCPMCKTLNEQLIVDHVTTAKDFTEYPLWGNELGGDYKYRENVGMFFPTQYYETEIEPLFGCQCLDCNEYDGTTPDDNIYEQDSKKKKKPPTPLRALQDHLRNKHRLALCQLCVDHKRDFISRLPRFTPSQLKHHLQKGDGQGSRGHPLCEFCRPKRFYDIAELYTHLGRDHYKCHVCEKQGLHNQYFRNYDSLEKHFETHHFLCRDPACRAARFVVFENDIDLRGHEISTHGSTSSGTTKIQLEFHYRRAHEQSEIQQDVPTSQDFQYGLDGQAFVPEELPDNRTNHSATVGIAPERLHPLHLQRTNELRAHAAQIRLQQQEQEQPEAFPSLQGNSVERNSNTPLRVGWNEGTSQRLGRSNPMAQEDFPSLPSSTTRGKNSVRAKLTSSGSVASNRQFASIQSASAVAPSGWSGSSNAAATAASMTHSSFPSLTTTSTRSATAMNRESNLTQDNFPSLGGGTSTRYAAAEGLAKKKAPSLKSDVDFPPPPSAKPAPKASVRQQVLAPTTPPNVDNVLDFPPPPTSSSAQATVDHIKASLGSVKYKQLKRLTQEFAADAMAPNAYVDHAASLFEKGYADADFWSFLPTLLSSCPNTSSANKAKQYMEELRQNQKYSSNSGGWTNPPPKVSLAAAPHASSRSTPAYTARVSKSVGTKQSGNAWNAGTALTVARAKQRPGSVSVAAQESFNTNSTATKFMAKQAKQGQKQGSKKAKKKQNEELRALAFGGKK